MNLIQRINIWIKLKQSKIYEDSESNLNNNLKADKKLEQFNLEGINANITKDNLNETNLQRNRIFSKGNLNNKLTSSRNILNHNDNFKNSISISNKQKVACIIQCWIKKGQSHFCLIKIILNKLI